MYIYIYNREKYKSIYNNLITMMKKSKTDYQEIDNFYYEISKTSDLYPFKSTSLSEFIEAEQRISIMINEINNKVEFYRYSLLNAIYTSQINVFTRDLESINKYSNTIIRFNSNFTVKSLTLSTTMRTVNSLHTESLYTSIRLLNKLYVYLYNNYYYYINIRLYGNLHLVKC